MSNELNIVISEIRKDWDSMSSESLSKIKSLIKKIANNVWEEKKDAFSNGIELYRDEELGFIFFYYTEVKDTYRIPHNHGNAWVIYAVIEGEVQMGNYFRTNGDSKLIQKSSETLKKGDVQIYFPGEIHDTRCISEKAIILRLTSCDLKIEEKEGRMLRFES